MRRFEASRLEAFFYTEDRAIMRLTKIYTKVGDKGTTMLADGSKVSKTSKRINAYGTIDELNAVIGMLRDEIALEAQHRSINLEGLKKDLLQIQNELFDIGGELATPLSQIDSRQQVVGLEEITRLESEMDEMNLHLPPLKNFILPGGHRANSVGHLARTVCRRAERSVLELAEEDAVREETKIYLNRLSDWLFVFCRELSRRLEVQELLWSQKGKV